MSADYGPRRGPMSGQELRARLAIADLEARDLSEILGSTARVLAAWRAAGVVGAERRVTLRRTWPELAGVLDALNRGQERRS